MRKGSFNICRSCLPSVVSTDLVESKYIDNLNTTQTLEYTKDKYNVKIRKWKGLS
jgi:hypothetical protein